MAESVREMLFPSRPHAGGETPLFPGGGWGDKSPARSRFMPHRNTQMDFNPPGIGGKDFGLCQEMLEVSRDCPALWDPAGGFLCTCLTPDLTADFQL